MKNVIHYKIETEFLTGPRKGDLTYCNGQVDSLEGIPDIVGDTITGPDRHTSKITRIDITIVAVNKINARELT